MTTDGQDTRLVPGVGRLPHPAYRGDGPYVFVSYCHEDHDAVFAEIARFNEAGFNVWYDEGLAPGNEWAEEIASALEGCSVFVVMVTPRSVLSNNVLDEIAFALDEGKPFLAIYLEQTELPGELRLRTRRIQAILKYTMDEEEYAWRLTEALSRLGLQGRDSESGDVSDVGAGLGTDSDDVNTAAASSAAAISVAAIDDESNEDLHQRHLLSRRGTMGFISFVCMLLVAMALAYFFHGSELSAPSSDSAASQSASAQAASSQSNASASQATQSGENASTASQQGLAQYSWAELKTISNEIASAPDDAAGLEIAKKYGLVGADGKLQGDEKPVTLTDGTTSNVRILGFRHDELASGGLAGISFEFADVPLGHEMNNSPTNVGGWEACEMRAWLNSDFLGLLPPDLRSCVAEVKKWSNNVGYDSNGDLSAITATTDALWLLSLSEVYGETSNQVKNVPGYPSVQAVYDAEGAQYQYYADQGVTTANSGFCKKHGADSWWWLRTPVPYANGETVFHAVSTSGGWNYTESYLTEGVSPGFCL